MTTRAHRRSILLVAAVALWLFAGPALSQESAAPSKESATPSKEPAAPPKDPAALSKQPAAPSGGSAFEQVPLYELEPFDRITLNTGEVIDVLPIDLPNRRVPEKLPTGMVQVRLLEDSTELYELPWRSVATVELFEQMVLGEAGGVIAEARQLTQSGDSDGATARLDDAYEYFDFLLDEDPKLPGLEAVIDDYLHAEALLLQAKGQHGAALARFRELAQRNPNRPGVEEGLGQTTEWLVDRYVEADDYWAARRLLRNLAGVAADHPTVKRKEGQFIADASALLANGKEAVRSGKLRDAHEAGRRVMHVWPHLPGAQEFMDSIQRQHPRVVVGVCLPAVDDRPGRLHDWASRRASRLAHRTLTEFVGRTSGGPEYDCPLGELRIERLEHRLAVQVDQGIRWSGGAYLLTGYDLARQFLAMADPASPDFRIDWADRNPRVSVEGVFTANADLSRPHVRPEALLRTLVIRRPASHDPAVSGADQAGLSNGPYVVDQPSQHEVIY
ncbi:MAG: tetratricopeptide repeat protein, partial [Planctomycetota bacterium]